MKYTQNERLRIGMEVYSKKIDKFDASIKYGISPYTAVNYMNLSRRMYDLPARQSNKKQYQQKIASRPVAKTIPVEDALIEKIKTMNADELIRKFVAALIAE